jgi:agmatinase
MNIVPIAIGGEHTISYGVLKAMDIQNATIIHFDAHMDLRDEYMGERFSHAAVMRRIFDLNPKEVIQIGVRSCSEEEMLFAKENNITYFMAHDVNRDLKRVQKVIKDIEGPLYVSIDIDVLDPAFAPSVGTPTPCGLDPFQLESLIHCLNGKEVIGLDLVELSSTEIGDITSINGAKAIYDFLCTQ